MEKRTKIVCTIGPSTDGPGVLEAMIANGMNVARFNFSHGTHEEHKQRMRAVREAAKKVGCPVALLLDTKGPEIRLGRFKDGPVLLEAGQPFSLSVEPVEGDKTKCFVSHRGLVNDVTVGGQILLSDGLVSLRIEKIEGPWIHTRIENTGEMKDFKRVAVPGVSVSLPPVSETDEADLRFGCLQGVDFVAASFVQRASDVAAIRRIMQEGDCDCKIIAKIENKEGLLNLEEILDEADGLMVARGDLGVEIPAEEVPILQKKMIQACRNRAKPVITATQMLESMIVNPRPTRAEASDVANAIFDGTDAIMLSGETAGGAYPVEAVATMTKIAKVTESSDLYCQLRKKVTLTTCRETDALTQAACDMAETLGARAIISCTESGVTALNISRNRPLCTIIAVTPHGETIRRMQLYWGIEAVIAPPSCNSDELVRSAIKAAKEAQLVADGELVVVTAGIPSGLAGTTNMIRVHRVGDILVGQK